MDTHYSLARSFAFCLLCACGTDHVTPLPDAPTPDEFTAEERAILATLRLADDPSTDPTNAYGDNAAAAKLGQMLFFDKSYSGALIVGDDGTNHGLGRVGDTGKVSCASCHTPGSATLDDQRSLPNHVSLGTNVGTRNAHGLVNSSYYAWTNWGGRFDSQWSLPPAVAENPNIMRSTRLQIAHLLFDKYRSEYDAVFPIPLDADLATTTRFPASGRPKAMATDPDGPWELMTSADRDIVNRIFANYGKAIAAYTRTLVSKNAPFDRFIAGDDGAISPAAKGGVRVFLAHCVSCHAGPNLADDKFYAIGVVQEGTGVPPMDLGRFQDVPPLLASPFNSNGVFSDDTSTGRLTDLTQLEEQKGTFRTKSLRGVAGSAPYMHTGQHQTLMDVVDFYDRGGDEVPGISKDSRIRPLGLSVQEKADLVALLETFTGEPVPVDRLADLSK
jgi:cytochrome c peroxidase